MEHEELAGCDAEPAERIDRLQRFPIEHPDPSRTPAGRVEEALCRIGGERDARGGLPVAASFADSFAPAIDPRLRDELAVNGEDLNALAAAIGGIHEAVV